MIEFQILLEQLPDLWQCFIKDDMRFIVVALINTDEVAEFFTGNRPDDELGFEALQKICVISHTSKTLAHSIEEKLARNEVVSQLFSDGIQKISQSNTLCKCRLPYNPLIILRSAQGPVETDPYMVEQRRISLTERARLQKDNSAQDGLTLAAKLEVETDRVTGRPYILTPSVARIIVSFFMSRDESNSDYRYTTATITVQPHRVLEYDLATLSVSMIGPQGFKRKMTSREIDFLSGQYEQSMIWATEAIKGRH